MLLRGVAAGGALAKRGVDWMLGATLAAAGSGAALTRRSLGAGAMTASSSLALGLENGSTRAAEVTWGPSWRASGAFEHACGPAALGAGATALERAWLAVRVRPQPSSTSSGVGTAALGVGASPACSSRPYHPASMNFSASKTCDGVGSNLNQSQASSSKLEASSWQSEAIS